MSYSYRFTMPLPSAYETNVAGQSCTVERQGGDAQRCLISQMSANPAFLARYGALTRSVPAFPDGAGRHLTAKRRS